MVARQASASEWQVMVFLAIFPQVMRGGVVSYWEILLPGRGFSTRLKIMVTLEIPVDESWLLSSGRSRADVEQELRCILAAKLFELRSLTLAQAAIMAGMPLWQFMEALSSLQISAINMSPDDLADELARA